MAGPMAMPPVLVLLAFPRPQGMGFWWLSGGQRHSPKPLALDQCIKAVQAIDTFWFSIVTLPPGDHHE